MNLCRVSIDEIAHDLSSSKYHAAVKRKTDELFAGKFDPISDDNFLNFFSADLTHRQLENLLGMRNLLRAGKFEVAAVSFRNALYSFYLGLARMEAEHQINNAYCGHCFDAGCHHCIEQEVE